jgi:CRP-like cAMP-binding protein
MRQEKDQYIEQFRLWDHLNGELLQCLKLFRFEPQHELFVQSLEQAFVYWLVSGSAQVNHYHTNGKLSVLAILKPLSIIGDLEIFTFDRIKTNVVILEQSSLLGVEKTCIERYGYDDPRFLRFIIQNLSHKLYQSTLLQIGTVQPLLYRFSSYLIEICGSDTNVALLPLRSHLAALLGTTPRHLTRVIKQLEEQNIIEVYGRTITILDRQKLLSFQ